MWPAVIWQNIFHSLWSLVTMLPQIASSEYGQNPESSLKSCKPNQILTLGTTFPFSSGRTLWIVLNTSWWSTSFICREGCKQPARPPSGQEWFYPESFSLSWKARINKALLFVWFVDLRTYIEGGTETRVCMDVLSQWKATKNITKQVLSWWPAPGRWATEMEKIVSVHPGEMPVRPLCAASKQSP